MMLGCADDYFAMIHLRGGTVQWVPLHPESITALSWGRKLGDYSEASVTFAKKDLPRECIGRIADTVDETGQITPGAHCWSHELTIYRNGGIVWQGPIVQPEESRTEITFDARDALFWNDRRVLAASFQPSDSDAGWVLRRIMDITWPRGSGDDPNIAAHWRIDAPAGRRYVFDKAVCPGSTYVGKLIRDVCAVGIDQFTLGRKIFMVPSHYRTAHAPYRLHQDDFLGELTVREGGLDFTTEGYAFGKEEQGEGCLTNFGIYPGPNLSDWFGRITKWRQSSDTNDKNTLVDMGRATYEFGWPPPRAVVVPEGSRLSPEAPVTIGQLVPGRTFQVALPDFIYNTAQRFRLNEVEVSWQPPDPESVQISLVTVNQNPEGDTP